MKEKIDKLAKGIFEYETPSILLSDSELIITTTNNRIYNGSFTITNSSNTPIKGIVYSSHDCMKLEQTSFVQSVNTITYSFDAKYFNAGESIKGEISIISNYGEHKLPFTVNIEEPYVNSSIGKIKDLFNFANLAKMDWAAAVKIFKTEEFRMLLIHHDSKYYLMYLNLIKSKSISQAMEEFLIAVHKKTRITFSVNKPVANYQLYKESIMDKLILTKDNWGYAKIQVSTDAPFIKLDHKMIWSDNFLGNTYSLEYVLDPQYMRSGNNYGRIYLKGTRQTISIEVTCKCNKMEDKTGYNSRKIKVYSTELVKSYIQFRKNKIQLEDYVTKSIDLLDNLRVLDQPNYDYFQLLRCHMLLISGQDNQVDQILKEYQGKAEEWKDNSVIHYSIYLYLIAMLKKSEESIHKAITIISTYYNKENSDWRLLWILLHLDAKYDLNKGHKLSEIKKQYENGCNSPILYFEAALTLGTEPSLLHELGKFEQSVINFCVKYNYIDKDLASQYTYIASKRKSFNKGIYRCLSKFYEQYPSSENLRVICSLLIKGNKKSNKYFHWFELGVKEQLRITELYEYYMYSIDEHSKNPLPDSVLLYFIYNSNLNDRKRAFLYAYVINNKESNQAIYRTYLKHIEQYALRQLNTHNCNVHLSVLYEELIAIRGLTEEIANNLPYVMFKHEICCDNPEIKGVFVVHKEMDKDIYYPIMNNMAIVDIYTDNVLLVFVDNEDNRYTKTIDYTINQLMQWDNYVSQCYEYGVNHPMLLMNLLGKALSYQKFDSKSIDIRKQTLEIDGLQHEFYTKNLIDLIFYYYDNFEGELLEAYLSNIELADLDKSDRNKIIELYIIRDMYEKAITAVDEYGYFPIAVKRLIKLCQALLEKVDEEDERSNILLKLSYHIFSEGKYNEAIIKLLVKQFNGTTYQMFELWKAAIAFEIETIELEERLLAQMLFTESYIVNSVSVFLKYYRRGSNHKLIKAYLSYNAYKYLVMDRVIQPELFDIMKKEMAYEEITICMLALLKELSTHEELTEDEVNLVDYNLNKFIQSGIVFSFFKVFKKYIPLPHKLSDKVFVEYRTNPTHKVMLHYRFDNKEHNSEYTTKDMKHVLYGIYIKEFTLFFGESLQYYITEENEKGETTITESVTIRLDSNLEVEDDSRYNQLNVMLASIAMKDETSLIESMSQYAKNNYLTSTLFNPL